MKRKRESTSAAMLAADLAGDPAAAARVEAHQSDMSFVRELTNMRVARKLTQRELAVRMGVGPSKVCRIEASCDKDLNLGDVLMFAKALGVNMSVLFDDPTLPASDRIKHHVIAVHGLLEQLRQLAHQVGGEDTISVKIKQFYGEVLFNFAIRFGDSYCKLPGATPIRFDQTEVPAKADATDSRAITQAAGARV